VVDGTRDRPPGKMAENWSRRDHIRAGAVSGPWRSAPRPDAAAAPPSAHEPTAEPRAEAAAEPWPAAPTAPRVAPPPVTAAVTAPGIEPIFEPIDDSPDRRRRGVMLAWIGFGLIFVAACVAAAFLLRPEPSEVAAPEAGPPIAAPDQASGTAADAEPTGPAAGEAVVATPDPAAMPDLSAVGHVRLRVGTGFAGDAALADALAAAGIADVRIEQVPFVVNTSRVGYYRPEDLAIAQALAGYASRLLDARAPIGVRDYGELLADPDPGRLDLWIAGPPDP
jgi:hypothetical protein